MKHNLSLYILIISLFFGVGDAFAMAKYPSATTEIHEEAEMSGIFTVYFYGYNYQNDPESAVFFDIEGDDYTFEIFGHEYDYVVLDNLQADEARKEAEKFISQHTRYYRSQLSRIFDHNGKLIGYELRPLYHTIAYGRSDILDIYYRIKDSKVVIAVDIKRPVRRRFFDRDQFHD